MKNGVFWDVRRVALKRSNVSEEFSTSIIRVTRIGELGASLALTNNQRTLRRNTTVASYG
jgi:demethoxyubiquinone hydroxylase (CLK1/Coq7/Cat5 family)